MKIAKTRTEVWKNRLTLASIGVMTALPSIASAAEGDTGTDFALQEIKKITGSLTGLFGDILLVTVPVILTFIGIRWLLRLTNRV